MTEGPREAPSVDGRVVIVTGGTHGIGRACVEVLAAEGCAVIFQGRDVAAGREVEAAAPGSRHVAGDLTDAATVDRLVAIAAERGGGRIDGLVNNAGLGLRKPFADLTLADWDRVLGLNARAAFAVTRAALAALREARGSVVFVSSVAGLGGEAELSAYCASKAALIGLTKALALELGAEVRFNAICPGQIATRMMKRVVEDPALVGPVAARIPQGRFGTAREVADAAAWLLSPRASFVNGAVFTVDGGETAGLASIPPPPSPPPARS